jgi:2-succinyl-6-hydroxy-2,4-cyclohexadiene-1-carboxylate synthase
VSTGEDPQSRRVVLVHGFAQNSDCWGDLPAVLTDAGYEVVALDAPGHGSQAGRLADLLGAADYITAEGGRATYVGYSMGGRMCLHAALLHPDVVERLVVISATGGIDDPTERAARRQSDNDLADTAERLGLPEFLSLWAKGPIFSTLPPQGHMRAQRMRNTAEGLASSLRLAGTGTQEPIWAALRQLQMPVLVVSGALDTKFTELARRLQVCIGANATLEIVDGAGHTVHIEQPQAFSELLLRWLAQ